jgi:hypothetical protein
MPIMPHQLAENSVRTYHFPPEEYVTARNKLLKQRAVVFAGIILFVFVLAYKMFGEILHEDSIASLLPPIVFALIVSGMLVMGVQKGIKRHKESWDSFELVVGEDFVIRRIKDFPELEIQRREVIRIRETTTDLYVETQAKDRTIGIARTLTDYKDARDRLSRWMPLVQEPPRKWTAPTRWIWMAPLITVILFAFCFMSTNNLVVVAAGLPLAIWLSVSMWILRRSVQVSAHMKRLSLLTVLPLLAIIAKLIQAIHGLR